MTDTTIATTEDMTEEEGARLIELEREVEKAMRSAGRIAGAALAEIRDQRLYRASHRSFDAYVLERHGLARSTAYAMIATARGETNGLPPAVTAIARQSALAAERRHMTLDQPPTTIEPPSEPFQEAPERHEEDDDDEDGPDASVTYLQPDRPVPHSINDRLDTRPREGRPPEQERLDKLKARQALNRLSAVLAEWVDELPLLASCATKTERLMVSKFAAACLVEDRKAAASKQVARPEECDHPVNRLIGNQCGKCGAVRKGASR